MNAMANSGSAPISNSMKLIPTLGLACTLDDLMDGKAGVHRRVCSGGLPPCQGAPKIGGKNSELRGAIAGRQRAPRGRFVKGSTKAFAERRNACCSKRSANAKVAGVVGVPDFCTEVRVGRVIRQGLCGGARCAFDLRGQRGPKAKQAQELGRRAAHLIVALVTMTRVRSARSCWGLVGETKERRQPIATAQQLGAWANL